MKTALLLICFMKICVSQRPFENLEGNQVFNPSSASFRPTTIPHSDFNADSNASPSQSIPTKTPSYGGDLYFRNALPVAQQRPQIRAEPPQKFKKPQEFKRLPSGPNDLDEELKEEEEEEPDRLSILLPQSKFNCIGKNTGYYADEGLGCEVFHYCQDNAKHSWICPESFSFHQVHLICMPAGHDNICQQSTKYHFVNDYLYKPVNLEEHQSKPNITLRYSERYYPDNFYYQQDYSNEELEPQEPNYRQQAKPVVQVTPTPAPYRPVPIQISKRPYQNQFSPTFRPESSLQQVFRSPEELQIPIMLAPKEEQSVDSSEKRTKFDQRMHVTRRTDKNRHRKKSSIENVPSTLRLSKTKDKYVGPPILILDNGSYMAKVGMSSDNAATVLPNCIMKVKSERKRFFIGNQIDECRDLSGLYYLLPSEKGYTVRWNVQKPVWDYIFNNVYSIEDRPVILTQPIFNFKAIQEIIDEIFFEEYEIKSMFRICPSDLAKYEYLNNIVGKNVSCIVVDSGFSVTTVIPYLGGKKYYPAAKRINIGGKILTNYLKDIISYRQLHVMDETYVINQVKKILVIFMQKPGESSNEITEGCQILRLNNERFTVPELLFHPSDVGIESVGIAECIVKSIQLCPLKERSSLAKNIILIGGNACFPGFKERVYADLRSYLPDHWTVNVYKPENPITFAWKGGNSLAADPKIKSLLITKEQYEEMGSAFTYERFSDWLRSEKSQNQNEQKSTGSIVENSVLEKGHFTRFDLFGKHEPETEEVSDVDNENTCLSNSDHIRSDTGNVDISKDGEKY
ncbi:hypothetical protein FQA39_LY10721 [Lamprigera yunnana]|nr:hypothetical protein FQA39_LY10721 [Lamprigera yunnana]